MSGISIQDNTTIGVALSGGFLRAWANIGVLDVFIEQGLAPHIKAIAGSSAGAVVAAAFALDRLDELRAAIARINSIWSIIDFHPNKWAFGKGDRLQKLLTEVFGEAKVSDATVGLFIQTHDCISGTEYYPSSTRVATAVQAAVTLPTLLPPVKIKDKMLVDGGAHQLLPSRPLLTTDVDMIIGVTNNIAPNNITQYIAHKRQQCSWLDSLLTTKRNIQHMGHVLLETFDHATEVVLSKKNTLHDCDVVLKPEISYRTRWRKNDSAASIAAGREAAKRFLKDLK